MTASFIIFIFIQLCALTFLIEALRRIFKKSKDFPLDETHETLPLGFLRLRHVVVLYILMYLFWVVFSVWVYWYFLSPDLLFDFGRDSNAILNL